MVKWKIINDSYLDFLRNNYESRIPFSEYGHDKYKPFFGSLFEIGDLIYVTQVSHPKKKHEKLKEDVDFCKIYNPKNNNLMAVVNLNYMFPVHKTMISNLKYKEIDNYRTFKNNNEKSKYIYLLNTEIKIINSIPIKEKAIRVYKNKYKHPESRLAKRSFDFKLLEQAYNVYNIQSIAALTED